MAPSANKRLVSSELDSFGRALRLNCFPIAPPDERIEGFCVCQKAESLAKPTGDVQTFASEGIFSPTLSAALWIGLSSPASLREDIVKVAA